MQSAGPRPQLCKPSVHPLPPSKSEATPQGPSWVRAYRLVSVGTPPPPAAPHPEALFQQGQLTDEVGDGVGEGLLGAVIRCGLHPDDDLVLQGVWDFVASKQHLWVLEQLPETQG